MNPYYNQNYTIKEIEDILFTIKSCITKNRYTIGKSDGSYILPQTKETH